MNVPTATMANPIQSPYTTPQSKTINSCPNSGGKDIKIKIATGMRNPPGRSRTFCDIGLKCCGS
jgi:hypothetical protein